MRRTAALGIPTSTPGATSLLLLAARALHLHHDLQKQCGHVLAQQAVGARVQATARRARRLRRLEALAAIMLESDCASALVASVASLPLTLFGPLYMRPL